MLDEMLAVAILMLFAVMLPGVDFVLVTKNTLLHSRRAGIYTALGIATATLVHLTYCLLGLAIILTHSPIAFNSIKYLGAAYLIYLGIKSLVAKATTEIGEPEQKKFVTAITDSKAFLQGFSCNLLNPKAALFFLALFTTVIDPNTPWQWQIIFASEIFLIALLWFCSLTFMLSHPIVIKRLNAANKCIEKFLGICLIVLAVCLIYM